MLTVLHIGKDGVETLVECSTFRREKRSDGFFQFLTYDENTPPGSHQATWCGDMRGDKLRSQTLYVMNSKGATVATYTFDEPNFSEARGGGADERQIVTEAA